jgi:hypothetical protein
MELHIYVTHSDDDDDDDDKYSTASAAVFRLLTDF